MHCCFMGCWTCFHGTFNLLGKAASTFQHPRATGCLSLEICTSLCQCSSCKSLGVETYVPFILWPSDHFVSDAKNFNFQALCPCAGEGVKQSFCSQHHTLQSSFRLPEYSRLEAKGMARPTCTPSQNCSSHQQATRCIRAKHKPKRRNLHRRHNHPRQCTSSAFSSQGQRRGAALDTCQPPVVKQTSGTYVQSLM